MLPRGHVVASPPNRKRGDSMAFDSHPGDGPARQLARRLGGADGADAVVGVVGLGYVGLPVCLAFVAAGLRVVGFDVDCRRVARLATGRCDIPHLDPASFGAAVASGRLAITADASLLAEPDAVVIC